MDNARYPYLKPYCSYMGSYPYYARDEAERLAAMNAPRDAYATKHGGGYYQLRDMENELLRERLEQQAGTPLADLLAEERERLQDHAEDLRGDG